MDQKGQGALEYLIILAAVIAVAAVVVIFITGAFGGQREEASLARCRKTAAECESQLMIAPDATCEGCVDACQIEGEDIVFNATELCQAGKPELIGVAEENDDNGDQQRLY